MRRTVYALAGAVAALVVLVVVPVSSQVVIPQHYQVEANETYQSIATKLGLNANALTCANVNCGPAGGSTSSQRNTQPGTGKIIHLSPVVVTTTTTTVAATTTTAVTTTVPPTTTIAATTTVVATTTTTVAPSTTTTTQPPGGGFVEDFGSATAFDGFDHGFAGEWNAGSLNGDQVNNWHGDHSTGAVCGDPNLTNRTITLTGAQQANDAVFYPCTFAGDAAKSHLMTSVNTPSYITVWFSPKQTFNNVNRVCWDQNITWLGGGKWTVVNFLTSAEYSGQTDLGYTSPDFPDNGGPSSPQGAAQNGVKVFAGEMDTYTNGVFRGGSDGVTVSDKAARFQHCVIDNNNGTLTTTLAQPNGSTITTTVTGNIPNGTIRVVFVDDNYNPDKHCGFSTACVGHDGNGAVPHNSTDLYTWHWDNIVIAGG